VFSAGLLAAGCSASFEPTSGGIGTDGAACSATGTCQLGLVCVEGTCVTNGTEPTDAGGGEDITGGADSTGPAENQPPEIQISLPVDGAVSPAGEVVRFEATLTDDRDAPDELTARWNSSVDGNLGISLVDPGGETFLNVYDLSPGLHMVTILASDATGLEGSTQVTVIINAPPSGPGVELEPTDPQTGDELKALVSEVPSDLNRGSDELTYSWEWYADGVLQVDLTGPTVASEYTARGQEWEIRIAAYDGYAFGPEGTASVTISNTLPTCPAAEITPATGDTSTLFVCTCPERGDADQDAAIDHCTFLNSNIQIASVEAEAGECALDPIKTSRGMVLSCSYTAGDEGGDGSSGASGEAVIVNAVPSQPQVALSPAAGAANNLFTCGLTLVADDPDGDPLTYSTNWFVNEYMNLGVSSLSVTPADLVSGPTMVAARRGDIIRCEVNAHDGIELSLTGTSQSVVLANALPTASGVTLAPAVVHEGDTIFCTVEDPYDADGDPVDWSYAWKVNGALVAGASAPALGSDAFDRGDAVSCIATPHDGVSGGPSISSEPVIIQNTAPAIDSVTLTPSAGPRAATFTCAVWGLVDVDPGDAPEIAFEWFRSHSDGTAALLIGQTTSTLAAITLEPGDEVTCKATPSDGTLEGESQISGPALVVNLPPALPLPTVSPSEGTVAESFGCNTGLAEDGEGDPLTYEYQWKIGDFVNEGAVVEAVSAADLVSDELGTPARGGDALSCAVRASDTWDSSAWAQSAQLIFANSPPKAGVATVTPAAPGEADTASCLVSDVSDLDGDPVTFEIHWYVDGLPVDGEADDTLSGGAFDKDQTLYCSATPHDGTDPGMAIASAIVTVANTAPTLESVSIWPAAALRSESFSCDWAGWLDLDEGDPQLPSFGWYTTGDGGDLKLDTTGETLWLGDLVPGDQVFCRIVPSDGESQGAPVDSTLATVINLAPTLASVTLSPAAATGLDTLTCAAQGFEDGDGDSAVFAYSWLVDGAVVADAVESTLSGGFHEGNTVICQITPGDGFAVGDAIQSSGLDIHNALPSIESLSVSPAGGAPCEVYTCEVEGAYDPDPDDTLTLTYEWEVNGETVGDHTETLTGVELAPDDELVCRAAAWDGTVDAVDEPVSGMVVDAQAVTIVNATPTVMAVDLGPAAAGVGDLLTCDVAGFSDDGCDAEKTCYYTWMIDGMMAADEVMDTLDTDGLVVGTIIRCVATPYDPWTEGEPTSSAEITLL